MRLEIKECDYLHGICWLLSDWNLCWLLCNSISAQWQIFLLTTLWQHHFPVTYILAGYFVIGQWKFLLATLWQHHCYFVKASVAHWRKFLLDALWKHQCPLEEISIGCCHSISAHWRKLLLAAVTACAQWWKFALAFWPQHDGNLYWQLFVIFGWEASFIHNICTGERKTKITLL